MNALSTARAAPSTGRWQVALHRDHRALEAEWRRLETAGHCSVFQTYDWAASWYDAVARTGQAEPVIVTVRREDGGLHWLLPLCLHRRQGLRIVSFADLGASDYGGPVFAATEPQAPQADRDLMRQVRRVLPSCDVIHLQKLPAEIDGAPNPLMHLGSMVRMRESAYGIRVDRPWEQLKHDIMQSRLRTTIRQQRNKLERKGRLTLETASDPETIGPALEELFEMRRVRFAQIDRPDTPPEWRRFYHEVGARPARTLGVSVTTLRFDGEAIAICFGLMRGKAYHVILPTFAMGPWSSYSPGSVLFDEMLDAFAARVGNDGYFDFTIGDEPYKQRFGSTRSELHEWMTPTSPQGLLAYAYWRTKVYRRERARAREEQERDREKGG